jgi:hypothetical protein
MHIKTHPAIAAIHAALLIVAGKTKTETMKVHVEIPHIR